MHIAPAIVGLQGWADALYVAGDPLVTTNRNRIAILAVGARMPKIHGNRENVDADGRPSSIRWSTRSRPGRSASPSRRRCSPAPTRWSN